MPHKPENWSPLVALLLVAGWRGLRGRWWTPRRRGHHRHFESGGGDMAFLPRRERQDDLRIAETGLFRGPHGAKELVASASFAERCLRLQRDFASPRRE